MPGAALKVAGALAAIPAAASPGCLVLSSLVAPLTLRSRTSDLALSTSTSRLNLSSLLPLLTLNPPLTPRLRIHPRRCSDG